MTTFSTGRQAEAAAAVFLETNGFEILVQNWRTRFCEIDIVAKKQKRIYFVEVKYRQTSSWGGGLEYILPKKLKQMKFAAAMWVSEHGWGGDYCLAAVEVSGREFEITNFIDEL
jgi:uncharacterized protein (TIGR00252 family)